MDNVHSVPQGILAKLSFAVSAPRTVGRKNRIEMRSAIDARSAVETTVQWSEKADEELLAEYRLHQNRRAFEELVHRYERELYSYLRRYLSDATLAEDVFQATFLQLYLKADQFEEGRKVRPWLYTIATNQAIDAQRRNRRHKMVSLDRRGSSQEQRDEVGSLVDLLTSKEPGAAANLEGEERRKWIQRGRRRVAGSASRSSASGLLPGAKISGSRQRAGHTSGHCKKPNARGDFEIERSMV